MKRITVLRNLMVLAGCAALVCAADVGESHAATTATASSTGYVVQPLSIAKTADLNFGKFIAGASLGTVVVSTGNAQSVTGGVSTTTAFAASAAAATFTVQDEPLATYAISYPNTSVLANGGNSLTLDTFTTAVGNGETVGTLPAGGTQTLTIGATAHVAAGQLAGTYSGTFDVMVNYN